MRVAVNHKLAGKTLTGPLEIWSGVLRDTIICEQFLIAAVSGPRVKKLSFWYDLYRKLEPIMIRGVT